MNIYGCYQQLLTVIKNKNIKIFIIVDKYFFTD